MSAGSKLGRYELLARIATGGMGEIFLARLEGAAGFEKLCVIKRILPHLADDGRFRAMLIGEAQIASNMSHANICHVYELDETNHQLYMVMEYLEGVTLLELLRSVSSRDGQLDYGFIAGVVQQTCEGLHYAHEHRDRNGNSLGVVHRDITPSNLFLTETGVVKIVDFGIAKAKDTASTDADAVKGKYAYMAPEQLRGQAVDRRVDVFSLAVVVFEMLTCRRLFQRKTDYLTFRAVMEPPRIELQQYRPGAPAGLARVLAQALERDPDARYATVRQFAGALIEAFGATRPWAQGDIGELVRTTFADELSRNNAEISKLIKGSERESAGTIPVIMRRTPVPDESDYFSFETNVVEEPASSSESSQFSWHLDVRSDGCDQGPRVGALPSQPVPVVQSQASPMTPRRPSVLALVTVLGSAAAVLTVGLVLLGAPVPRRAGAVKLPAAAAASAGGTDRPRTARVRHRPDEPYGAAIHGHERELDHCARDYGEAHAADATAVIVVGVDGRAKQVALQPDSAQRSKLGGCIRNVLQVVMFPAAPDEKEVALGLALYREPG